MTTTLGPTDEQLANMRRNVLDRTSSSQHSRAPRRRITIALSGALAIAVAVIVIGAIPSVSPIGASPAAAAVLHDAALATIQTTDPVVGPGQFLRIDTNSVYIAVGPGKSGKTESWLNPTSGVVYIPADPRGMWVWERHNLKPTTFFSEGKSAAMDYFNDKDPDLNGVLYGKGGNFYGSAPENLHLDSLPRDPQKLRDYFYGAYKGGSNSIDEDVWVRITDLLRTGTVPADLRAGLYRAIALVPRVTLVDKEATLDGRTGIAIGRSEPGRNSRVDVIIDPLTGMLIGEREVSLAASGLIPANTVIGWSSVSTSVVNTTP